MEESENVKEEKKKKKVDMKRQKRNKERNSVRGEKRRAEDRGSAGRIEGKVRNYKSRVDRATRKTMEGESDKVQEEEEVRWKMGWKR